MTPPALPPSSLRWRCDPSELGFQTTEDVEPTSGILGQDAAAEAIAFGLAFRAPGQHVFVRARRGTGRLTLVHSGLAKLEVPPPPRPDRVLVHNFTQPHRPRLLELAPGTGAAFQRRMAKVAREVVEDLPAFLESSPLRVRLDAIEYQVQEELEAEARAFDEELAEAGLALAGRETEEGTEALLVPRVEGEPVPVEELVERVGEEQAEVVKAKLRAFRPRLAELQARGSGARRRLHLEAEALLAEEVRRWSGEVLREVREAHEEPGVQAWLTELEEDLVGRLEDLETEGSRPVRRYQANLLTGRAAPGSPPVVLDNNPTPASLFGTLDLEVLPDGSPVADHLSIRPGTLLEADGGFLILEALDVVSEPGSWQGLVRALRAGRLDWGLSSRSDKISTLLEPEPAALDVKVVLVGGPEVYAALDDADREFGELFKVLVDLRDDLPRDGTCTQLYARVIAKLAQQESLPPFDAEAVARLIEHGARVSGQPGRLTARFGRLGDILREAAFLASRRDGTVVTAGDVLEAIRRTKARAMLPAVEFRESVARGSLLVETKGREVGQVNGLAVIHAGPLTYGFPSRITATVGPGRGGTVNIEGEAELSGAIHTKGFHILAGLLRTLFPTAHPIAFDASIAFEQSYGGIDGDSASGAEFVALVSALTGLPVRQDLAMTGAIDQRGNVMSVGAVNEKIEGFFDLCSKLGRTGTQGVILPAGNVGALMLRPEVVEACEQGEFSVFAVDRIEEALELFLGRPAGHWVDGAYPEDSVLGLGMRRLEALWKVADPS